VGVVGVERVEGGEATDRGREAQVQVQMQVHSVSQVSQVSRWTHPGAHKLSLEALCVEVNALLKSHVHKVPEKVPKVPEVPEKVPCSESPMFPESPTKSQNWVMPATINKVVSEFELYGVTSSAQLAARFKTGFALNSDLNSLSQGPQGGERGERGERFLNEEVLDIFRELLIDSSTTRGIN
jgi:hypothetical protein